MGKTLKIQLKCNFLFPGDASSGQNSHNVLHYIQLKKQETLLTRIRGFTNN